MNKQELNRIFLLKRVGIIPYIKYKNNDGITSIRLIHPRHVQFKYAGYNHLWAFCFLRNEKRNFDIKKIKILGYRIPIFNIYLHIWKINDRVKIQLTDKFTLLNVHEDKV